MGFFNTINSFLKGSVGDNHENDPEDVLNVKRGLNRVGYYDMAQTPEPHGYITKEMDDGLKRFQKDHGLRVDGIMMPGGETEDTLFGRTRPTTTQNVATEPVQHDATGRMISPTQTQREYRLAQRDTPPKQTPKTPQINAHLAPSSTHNTQDNRASILKGVDDKIVKDHIFKSENTVEYMYKDTAKNGGKVTIGTGLMLPNVEAAKKIPFTVPDGRGGRRPATAQEIENAFKKIDGLKQPEKGKKYIAESYKPKTGYLANKNNLHDLRLADGYADILLTERLRSDAQRLRQLFPNFDTLSPRRQQALLDMQFNLGSTKFRESRIEDDKEVGWPELFGAVRKSDWKRAAAESHRNGVGETRNKDTYDYLIDNLE